MQLDSGKSISLPDIQIYAAGLMVWHLLLNSTSSWIHMKRTSFFSSVADEVTASRGLYGKATDSFSSYYIVYSVPYEYIKRKVDVRVTDKTIEIFYNHNRIASHRRLYGRKGQYSTVTEHMPESHQQYLEWNGDRFRKWAERIGSNTSQVVDAILTSKRVEQQSYRSCMGLLKLADKYSASRLEAACRSRLRRSRRRRSNVPFFRDSASFSTSSVTV